MLQNGTNSTFVTNDLMDLMDFLLDCAVVSYDVSYTWVEGSLQNMHATKTTNGSVLEIFHGSLVYSTVSNGESDLQSFLGQSVLAGNTTDSFLQEFGALYSTKVLAVIGGYSSSRTSLAEQQREHMLVTKVPIPALAVLVAWSLVYTVLGLVVAIQAYRAARGNIRNIAAKLSLLGLSQAAFGDQHAGTSSGSTASKEDVNRALKQELRRIHIHGSAQQGFEFGVML